MGLSGLWLLLGLILPSAPATSGGPADTGFRAACTTDPGNGPAWAPLRPHATPDRDANASTLDDEQDDDDDDEALNGSVLVVPPTGSSWCPGREVAGLAPSHTTSASSRSPPA